MVGTLYLRRGSRWACPNRAMMNRRSMTANRPAGAAPPIAKTTGEDFENPRALRPGTVTNEAVLVRSSAGPPAGMVAPQRSRLSRSRESGSANVFDHGVQPARDGPVRRGPVLMILPGLAQKSLSHQARPGRDLRRLSDRANNLARVPSTDGGQQTRRIRLAARRMPRLPRPGELFLGQDHDVAFATRAGDEVRDGQWRARRPSRHPTRRYQLFVGDHP